MLSVRKFSSFFRPLRVPIRSKYANIVLIGFTDLEINQETIAFLSRNRQVYDHRELLKDYFHTNSRKESLHKETFFKSQENYIELEGFYNHKILGKVPMGIPTLSILTSSSYYNKDLPYIISMGGFSVIYLRNNHNEVEDRLDIEEYAKIAESIIIYNGGKVTRTADKDNNNVEYFINETDELFLRFADQVYYPEDILMI